MVQQGTACRYPASLMVNYIFPCLCNASMKKQVKVAIIYAVSAHAPTLRCTEFSSSYLIIILLYLFLKKNLPHSNAIKLPSMI